MLTQSTSTSLSFPTPYPTPHLPHSAENVVFFTLALDFFFLFSRSFVSPPRENYD